MAHRDEIRKRGAVGSANIVDTVSSGENEGNIAVRYTV